MRFPHPVPSRGPRPPPAPPQVNGSLGGRRGAPGAELAFPGAAGVSRVTALSPLRRQRVKPEAKLTALTWGLRPAEVALEPLERAAEGGQKGGEGGALDRAKRARAPAAPRRRESAAVRRRPPPFAVNAPPPSCARRPAPQPPWCATRCPAAGPSTAYY
jgi:hypothetical protein